MVRTFLCNILTRDTITAGSPRNEFALLLYKILTARPSSLGSQQNVNRAITKIIVPVLGGQTRQVFCIKTLSSDNIWLFMLPSQII